jgi:hypothetical protein
LQDQVRRLSDFRVKLIPYRVSLDTGDVNVFLLRASKVPYSGRCCNATHRSYNAVDRAGELTIEQIPVVTVGAKSRTRFRNAHFVLDKFAR